MIRVAAGEQLTLRPGRYRRSTVGPSKAASTPRIPYRNFLPSIGLLPLRRPRRAAGRRSRSATIPASSEGGEISILLRSDDRQAQHLAPNPPRRDRRHAAVRSRTPDLQGVGHNVARCRRHGAGAVRLRALYYRAIAEEFPNGFNGVALDAVLTASPRGACLPRSLRA